MSISVSPFDGFLSPLGRLLGGGALSVFSPALLFSSGQQGVWFDTSDLTTLFQDSVGTTPVTAAGQPVGRMLDKSERDNYASQSTAAARPTYQITPKRLTIDKVDDRLIVTVPVGGWVGSMVLGTDQGTATYGVDIPAGAYDIGGKGGQSFSGSALIGQVIRSGALTAQEATAVEAYMVEAGATASYGAVTNFFLFWQFRSEITSFPLIETSAGTNFSFAWSHCAGLTAFPLIDTSSGTSFRQAWRSCAKLTAFPPLNTAAVTDFLSAWYMCTELTAFPYIDTSAGYDFTYAWYGCTKLTTFPANMFDSCRSLNFYNAFVNCALTQTSVDNILVSINAAGISSGTLNMTGGTSATPSATGITAKNALVSRGWTVTTN